MNPPAKLTFLLHRGTDYTIRRYLKSWGKAYAPCIRVRCYPSLRATGHTLGKRVNQILRSWRCGILPLEGPPVTGVPQIYVFGDLERLDPDETRVASTLWSRLMQHPDTAALLNHPARSLRRFELLRALHRRGLNDFNVFRASGGVPRARWPVFLRPERGHGGSSALFHGPDELASELDLLHSQPGMRLDDFLIVEHRNVADEQGIVSKLGSFRIGESMLARHVHFSRHWVVRVPDIKSKATTAIERAYVEENLHAERLRPIFDLAGIEYGRVDYGLDQSCLLAWEINTNPGILVPEDRDDPLRRAAHEHFAAGFARALDQLLATPPSSPLPEKGSV